MQLLNKWINPVQSGVFGLDIGSGSVKLLGLCRTSSGWTATCAAWSDIESTSDKTPRYSQSLCAIRECIGSVPQQSARYAVCGLSGPDAAVRGFNFPPLPPESVDQAVRFEAQQVCPMEMRHSVLDYQLMQLPDVGKEKAQKRCGVLVAGTEQAIGDRCQQVKEAGSKIVLMDAEGLAALNCLSELENLDRYKTVALIDMGRQFTNVILLGPDGLPFVRDLESGSHAMMAQICQVTGSDAKTVRAALWGAHDTPISEAIQVALHQAARPLVTNINETLKFYSTQGQGTFAEKVYLCGGAALVRPLAELLCDALPTEVAVLDPFKTIQFNDAITGADLLKTRGPAFVVAAGLAMRTV